MGPNHSGVEHEPLQVRFLQRGEDFFPAPLLSPAVEALEDTVPVAIALRQVTPGNVAACDPEYSILDV